MEAQRQDLLRERHAVCLNYIQQAFDITTSDVEFYKLFPNEVTSRLTPDLYRNNGDPVFIGDVACSTNTRMTMDSKLTKYSDLYKQLTAIMPTLQMKMFIFEVNGDNIGSINATILGLNGKIPKINIIEQLNEINMKYSNLFKKKMVENVLPNMEYGDLGRHEMTTTEEELYNIALEETTKRVNTEYPEVTHQRLDSTLIKIQNQENGNATEDKEEKDIRNPLMFALNCQEKEEHTDLKLASEYKEDLLKATNPEIRNLANFLIDARDIPYRQQLQVHKKARLDNESSAYSKYQSPDNPLVSVKTDTMQDLRKKIIKPKNTQGKIKVHSNNTWSQGILTMERMLSYFTRTSEKPESFSTSIPVSDLQCEMPATRLAKQKVKFMAETNACQYLNTMQNLRDRILKSSNHESRSSRFYVPPNATGIFILPGQHAPVSKGNVQVPVICISRYLNYEDTYPDVVTEKIGKYTYVLSRLCRLDIDKLSKLNCIVEKSIISTYASSVNAKWSMNDIKYAFSVFGFLGTDLHQKPSDLLDLLKYTAWMPMANFSRLTELLDDKMMINYKHITEVWIATRMITHMKQCLKGHIKVQKVRIKNLGIDPTSLAAESVLLPSFILPHKDHTTGQTYVEEMSALFIIRPKKLYGKQYLDQNITDLGTRENTFHKEKDETGFAVNGISRGPDDKFKFDTKFGFHADALAYATQDLNQELNNLVPEIAEETYKQITSKWGPEICSLRGCMKAKDDRRHESDLFSTALDESIKYYNKSDKHEFSQDNKLTSIAKESLKEQWEFSVAAKEQRGGGRPICSPTYLAKCGLAIIEAPERAIGKYCQGNVIVQGKSKVGIMHNNYKSVAQKGHNDKHKILAQVTEDKTKYSEEDNMHKALPYFQESTIVSKEYRSLQWNLLNKNFDRIHRRPKLHSSAKGFANFVDPNGMHCTHGWAQGMLNHLSTTVCYMAGKWINKIWNKFSSPKDKVNMMDEVHSDDSHYTISADSLDVIKRYTIFRKVAMKFFCLKTNEKKTYAATTHGEMVSNFCIGGDIISAPVKSAVGALNALLNWSYTTDARSIISAMSQMLQSGATLGLLHVTQHLGFRLISLNYGLTKSKYDRKKLPIELGGIPNISSFTLALTGEDGIRHWLVSNLYKWKDTPEYKLINAGLAYSKYVGLNKRTKALEPMSNTGKVAEFEEVAMGFDTEAPTTVHVPEINDLFNAIGVLLPIPKGQLMTIKNINMLPQQENRLLVLLSYKKNIDDVMSEIKSKAKSTVYKLAVTGYSQKAYRVALQQSMNTGKIWTLGGKKYTHEGLLDQLLALHETHTLTEDDMNKAIITNTSLTYHTNAMVNNAEIIDSYKKRPSIINKMPSKYAEKMTILPLKLVLLSMADLAMAQSDNLNAWSKQVIEQDQAYIKRQYAHYFNNLPLVEAVLGINAEIESRRKTTYRCSFLDTSNYYTFVKGLYGTVLFEDETAIIRSSYRGEASDGYWQAMVNSLASMKIYTTQTKQEGLFPEGIETSKGKHTIKEVLQNMDITSFDYRTAKAYHYLMFQETKESVHINRFYNSKNYRQKWNTRQKYDEKTKEWYGYMDVHFYSRGIQLRLVGTPGESLKIYTNTSNIRSLLKTLHAFIKMNFTTKSYKVPTGWGESGIFSQVLPQKSTYYLTYEGQYNTSITKKLEPHKVQLPLEFENDTVYYTRDVKVMHEYTISNTDSSLVLVKEAGTKIWKPAFSVNIRPYFDPSLKFLYRSQTYKGFPIKTLQETGVLNAMVCNNWKSVNPEPLRHYVQTNSSFLVGHIYNLIGILQGIPSMETVMEQDLGTTEILVEDITVSTVQEMVPTTTTLGDTPEDFYSLVDYDNVVSEVIRTKDGYKKYNIYDLNTQLITLLYPRMTEYESQQLINTFINLPNAEKILEVLENVEYDYVSFQDITSQYIKTNTSIREDFKEISGRLLTTNLYNKYNLSILMDKAYAIKDNNFKLKTKYEKVIEGTVSTILTSAETAARKWARRELKKVFVPKKDPEVQPALTHESLHNVDKAPAKVDWNDLIDKEHRDEENQVLVIDNSSSYTPLTAEELEAMRDPDFVGFDSDDD